MRAGVRIRDAHTCSSCSTIHEWRSSSMSLYRRAYCAAFCVAVTEAFMCCSSFVNRMRTSNGSAIFNKVRAKAAGELVVEVGSP